MDELEQRIAIAESTGWKRETRKRYGGEDNVKGWGFNTHLSLGSPHRYFVTLPQELPDFPNDAKAMREAVMTIKDRHEQHSYLLALAEVCCGKIEWYNAVEDAWKFVNATPAQCAKAFLKTKGKWRD